MTQLEDCGGAAEKLNRGIALRDSGDLESAAKLFLEVGEAGLAQGYCELADLARYEGKKEEAHQWVQRMEGLAGKDADGGAHLSCYLAYEFRMANCSDEEQAARAKDHLQQAAELGCSTAQVLLAGRYRGGAGGFPRDASLYEHWVSQAMEQGDVDALCYYVECLVQDGRAVSSELRSKLASVAELSERAAEALREVDNAGLAER